MQLQSVLNLPAHISHTSRREHCKSIKPILESTINENLKEEVINVSLKLHGKLNSQGPYDYGKHFSEEACTRPKSKHVHQELIGLIVPEEVTEMPYSAIQRN